jgi:uncharacterized protein YqgQ
LLILYTYIEESASFVRGKGGKMKSILEIRQLLKRYGTYIYTGDKIADLELMEDEVRELYRSGVLDAPGFQAAMMVIRQEISKQR